MRGWRGYFGYCETPEVLVALTRWVRLRLRAARGPWPIARSKALCFGLSNAYFKSLGLPSLFGAC